MKVIARVLLVLTVATTMAAALEGTSFNFAGTQYTFYPGQKAVNFDEAQAFCSSVEKDLALFDSRIQVLNVSEYISEEGGVWTNYRTDKDASFATADKAGRNPWKEVFAMPNAPEYTPSDASKCGLLSLIGNDTGIVPVDCKTKKAALCSSDLKRSPTTDKETSAKSTPSTAPKKAGKNAPKPVSEQVTEPVKNTPKPDSKQVIEPKGNTPKPVSKQVVEPKKNSLPTPKPTADSKLPKKPPTKSTNMNTALGKLENSNPTGKMAPDGKKPVANDVESEMKVEKKAEWEVKSVEPIKLVVEGTAFTYYPNIIHFGGWLEASRYCADHNNQQPAVFTSRTQLETVLRELHTGPIWTGYTTDVKGSMISVDSQAPWNPEFAMPDAAPNQKSMCGLASIVLNQKMGIYSHSCSSQRTVLCSAK